MLVRQLRVPVLNAHGIQTSLEAPAGVLDEDDPADCVRREAMEEAGLRLGALVHVAGGLSDAGHLDREDASVPRRICAARPRGRRRRARGGEARRSRWSRWRSPSSPAMRRGARFPISRRWRSCRRCSSPGRSCSDQRSVRPMSGSPSAIAATRPCTRRPWPRWRGRPASSDAAHRLDQRRADDDAVGALPIARACSAVLTPKPTQTGRSVWRLIRATAVATSPKSGVRRAGDAGDRDVVDEARGVLQHRGQALVVGRRRRQADEGEAGRQRRQAELVILLGRQVDHDQAVDAGRLGVGEEALDAIDVDRVEVAHQDDRRRVVGACGSRATRPSRRSASCRP